MTYYYFFNEKTQKPIVLGGSKLSTSRNKYIKLHLQKPTKDKIKIMAGSQGISEQDITVKEVEL
jgi:hypothetical protein